MQKKTDYVALLENLQKLNLIKISEILPSYLSDGASTKKPVAQILRELTDAEIDFRDTRAAEANLALAHMPCIKNLDDFDYDYQPSVEKARIMELKTLRFIEDASNVLLIGSSGVGKTHLAIGLGVEASKYHIVTYFIHFRDLVNRIKKAISEDREENLIKSLTRYKLLIIDEIGYFPIEQNVAGIIFQIIAARYEKKSTIVTSNKQLSKWDEVFGDATIANAIVDRLVHHSTIIRITGRSYRIKGKLDEGEAGRPAADPLGGPPGR